MDSGREIPTPFVGGLIQLFAVFVIMDLMVHNWLKRAMAGQLSMETYAKTVKDKDNQMMIIRGDKRTGKNAILVLAEHNPYLNEEVQEYVYEITKPYIKNYDISCMEETSIYILNAMSKNPIMSKEIITKLIDDLTLIFDEIENRVAPDNFIGWYASTLVVKVYSKYGEFLNNVCREQRITKNLQSKILNIASSANKAKPERFYPERAIKFGENLISSLVGNRFINVNERFEMTNQYLNPLVVSSFVKSKDVGTNHIASILSGISETNVMNASQISNQLSVMQALVESVNFEDDKLEKIFLSQQYYDLFRKKSKLYCTAIGRHEDYSIHLYNLLTAMSKRTKTEEARVNFLKIIENENNEASGNSWLKSAHFIGQLIASVMNTGKISEEFVDLLFKIMDKNKAFENLARTCSNNYHLFKYIFDKYCDKNKLFLSTPTNRVISLWIYYCIEKGIDCDSQHSLLNYWLDNFKSYFEDRDPTQDPRWLNNFSSICGSYGNYPLFLFSSRNKKCPDLIRKIISTIGRGSFRVNFYSKRIKEVKSMIAEGTWQKDS
jgi:hypothetical protein